MNFERMIATVEVHTEGEPFRIVTSGLPRLPGATIIARRSWAAEHIDHLRTALIHEPRGHADMYAGYLTDPVSAGADFGVIFAHRQGYSDHCGHGVIALATAAVELGWVVRSEPETRVAIDAPCGFIEAFAAWDGQRCERVRFVNVPSFVYRRQVSIATAGSGVVTGDIGFGGAFYVYVDGAQYGMPITAAHAGELVRFGDDVTVAANAAFPVVHPIIPELNHIYGTIISGPPADAASDQSNCCIFADGQLDRSPCGSGTAGRAAILFASGVLPLGQSFRNASLIGTTMQARVMAATDVGGIAAAIVEISGSAHVVGFANWVLDPRDPLKGGFLLR
jgi:trans-L-3-hydroxyproline dehydratase